MRRCLRITSPFGNKVRLIPFASIHSVSDEGDGSEVVLWGKADQRDRSICTYPAQESIDELERQFNSK